MYSSPHKYNIINAVSLSEPLIVLLLVSKYVLSHFYRNVLHYIPFCLPCTTLPPEKRLLGGKVFSSILPMFQLKGVLPSRTRMLLGL